MIRNGRFVLCGSMPPGHPIEKFLSLDSSGEHNIQGQRLINDGYLIV
jgi:hypothetical protein